LGVATTILISLEKQLSTMSLISLSSLSPTKVEKSRTIEKPGAEPQTATTKSWKGWRPAEASVPRRLAGEPSLTLMMRRPSFHWWLSALPID